MSSFESIQKKWEGESKSEGDGIEKSKKEESENALEEIKQSMEELDEESKKYFKELKEELDDFLNSLDSVESEGGDVEETKEEIERLQNDIREKRDELHNLVEVQSNLEYINEDKEKMSEEEKKEQENREERLENIYENHPELMTALEDTAGVFNQNCKFPWYVIGSISFLMHAQESTKQPDDIDLIFNDKDFEELEKKFKNIKGMTDVDSGEDPDTGSKFVRGVIKVKNEKGETTEVDIEAFGQSTEESNGLVNPGAKDQNQTYGVIENELNNEENFNILDKKGQSELYFKNLMTELKKFDLDVLSEEKKIKEDLGEKFKDKSDKFVNRLTNLMEMNNGKPQDTFKELKEQIRNPEDRLNLIKLMGMAREFKQKDLEQFKSGDFQTEIENLKEQFGSEKQNIIKNHDYINKQKEKLNTEELGSQDKEELLEYVNSEIEQLNELSTSLNKFESNEKEQNNSLTSETNEDIPNREQYNLSAYIFINKFKSDFVDPYLKKLSNIKENITHKLNHDND